MALGRLGQRLAAAAWLVASLLFSWYVANFGNYNETYGSLGAVIGFMTWIWISAIDRADRRRDQRRDGTSDREGHDHWPRPSHGRSRSAHG